MPKHFLSVLFISHLLFILSACSLERQEGPGEKIGKGVDQIMDGITDYDTQYGRERSAPEKRYDNRERYRYDQRREVNPDRALPQDDYVPECDPLYDPDCKSTYPENSRRY